MEAKCRRKEDQEKKAEVEWKRKEEEESREKGERRRKEEEKIKSEEERRQKAEQDKAEVERLLKEEEEKKRKEEEDQRSKDTETLPPVTRAQIELPPIEVPTINTHFSLSKLGSSEGQEEEVFNLTRITYDQFTFKIWH